MLGSIVGPVLYLCWRTQACGLHVSCEEWAHISIYRSNFKKRFLHTSILCSKRRVGRLWIWLVNLVFLIGLLPDSSGSSHSSEQHRGYGACPNMTWVNLYFFQTTHDWSTNLYVTARKKFNAELVITFANPGEQFSDLTFVSHVSAALFD